MQPLLRFPRPRRFDRKLPAEQFRRLERELLALLVKHGYSERFAETGGFTPETEVMRTAMATGNLTWRNILYAEVVELGGGYVGNVVWVDGLTLGSPNSMPEPTVEAAVEAIARILALCKWVFPRTKAPPPKDVAFRLFEMEFTLPREVVEKMRAELVAMGDGFVEAAVERSDATLGELLPHGLDEAAWKRMPAAQQERVFANLIVLAAGNRFTFDRFHPLYRPQDGSTRH